MLKSFNPSLVLSRRGRVYIVAEYDNTASTPEAVLYPFPDPSTRRSSPEPWKVTLPEVNSLIQSGEVSLAS